MLAGRYQGKDISVSTIFEAAGRFEAGKIDATDFMIKLVGSAQLADAEFAVSSGNLVFTSA